MSRELLEITPAGGLFCPVRFEKNRTFDFARPNGYKINDLLQQIRLQDPNGESGFHTDGDILRWALIMTCETPLGQKLAHEARFNDWMINVDDTGDSGPCVDADKKCMTLSRQADSISLFAQNRPLQMAFLFDFIRGLRVIWQENAGIVKADKLSAEEQILRARLIEADADLCTVLAAYQLKAAGAGDLWRYILSGDLSAVAVSLCECLEFDATADGTLDALGFVFQDWFLNQERLAEIDHKTLCGLDDQFPKNFGFETVGFDDVIHISTLPDGFSYLEYVAGEFITDDFYRHIADDTNRVHLSQIVAESSLNIVEDIGFRDTELARKIFPGWTYEAIV